MYGAYGACQLKMGSENLADKVPTPLNGTGIGMIWDARTKKGAPVSLEGDRAASPVCIAFRALNGRLFVTAKTDMVHVHSLASARGNHIIQVSNDNPSGRTPSRDWTHVTSLFSPTLSKLLRTLHKVPYRSQARDKVKVFSLFHPCYEWFSFQPLLANITRHYDGEITRATLRQPRCTGLHRPHLIFPPPLVRLPEMSALQPPEQGNNESKGWRRTAHNSTDNPPSFNTEIVAIETVRFKIHIASESQTRAKHARFAVEVACDASRLFHSQLLRPS